MKKKVKTLKKHPIVSFNTEFCFDIAGHLDFSGLFHRFICRPDVQSSSSASCSRKVVQVVNSIYCKRK